MTKLEFVKGLAEKEGKTVAEVTRALDMVLGGIETALSEGNEVNFTGFINFKIVDVKERRIKNVKTGEDLGIKPAHKTVRAKLGKKLNLKFEA